MNSFTVQDIDLFAFVGPQQSNFNRRGGHQSEIPSLLSQPMPLMDNEGPSRQRNNGELCNVRH